MKTILVDDELLSMQQFEEECKEIPEIELVGSFDNANDALLYARKNTVEFAIMDIEMPEMDGLELGAELKKINPAIIIIYVTGHSRYVLDALKLKADYYILKPYDKQDIIDAIYRAKLLSKRFEKRVKVETFGRFEVYIDNQPLYFGNSKARELFAYCIHRDGANVTMEQAVDILWPDRPYDEKVKRLYRKAIGAIQDTLEKYQAEEVFVNQRGSCHVEREKLECDLYHFLEGQPLTDMQIEKLKDGYMVDYEWAESRMMQLIALEPRIEDFDEF